MRPRNKERVQGLCTPGRMVRGRENIKVSTNLVNFSGGRKKDLDFPGSSLDQYSRMRVFSPVVKPRGVGLARRRKLKMSTSTEISPARKRI